MQRVESQFLSQLTRAHRIRQVLLVGKHQNHRVPQLVLIEHVVQFPLRLHHALPIVRVHHEDEALCVLEVVAPQRPNLVLAAHVPHREADVFVLHRLHVEADGRNGRDDFAEFEFVEDRGLAGGVEAH